VTFGGIVDRVDIYKDEDNVYIRVVDYKTGTKNFSLDDLAYGINTQMLLYLFTLCRSQSAEFKKSIGCKDEKMPLPAGVIYLSANISLIDTDDYKDEQDILQEAAGELERSGLLLDDEDVLRAMSRTLDPSFLMGSKKDSKDGTISGDSLVCAEEFRDIYRKLEQVIVKLATELRSGIAVANPLKYGKIDPCEYCSAKPICRNTNN
jgi:ATP-dependent helicase/nuclease subunit B